MSLKKIRTYYSSFWISFFGIMLLNQILLFVIFHLVTIRPTAKDMTQLFGASIEMARYLDLQDPEHGVDNLSLRIKQYPAISIEKKEYQLEEIPWKFLGLRMIRKSIMSEFGNEVEVGFARKENGTNLLIIQSRKQPVIALKVSFGATLIAQQYLQYSLFLVLVISIWAAYWISSRIVKPLELLSESAIKLSSSSSSSSSIDLTQFPVPEIKSLAKTLNHMQETIDNNIREREALLSSVTHDIRTPLSRMRIALELDKNSHSDFKNELLDDINEMNTIIQQFNELAKLNIEVDEPWSKVNLNELIKEIQGKYQRANIQLNTNLFEDLRTIDLKPISITRLLYNLIDNAYRHGNSDVTISTYQNHRAVMISVANPVSPEVQEHDSYQDPIFNHKTGLGLKIIKRLVDVHNATITQSTLYGVREYRLVFLT